MAFFDDKDHLTEVTCSGFMDFWTLPTSPLFKEVTEKGRSADPIWIHWTLQRDV